MKEIEFKFLGRKGDFVPAVPARDLEIGEAESRGILSLVSESPLYELIPAPKKQKKGENK